MNENEVASVAVDVLKVLQPDMAKGFCLAKQNFENPDLYAERRYLLKLLFPQSQNPKRVVQEFEKHSISEEELKEFRKLYS